MNFYKFFFKIVSNALLLFFSLIRENFVVTATIDGLTKIWDLQLALRPSTLGNALRSESLLINSSARTDTGEEPLHGFLFTIMHHFLENLHSEEVLVDDYQIVRFRIERDPTQDPNAELNEIRPLSRFELNDFSFDRNLEQLTEMLTRSSENENLSRGVSNLVRRRARRAQQQAPQAAQQQGPPEENQQQENELNPPDCCFL